MGGTACQRGAGIKIHPVFRPTVCCRNCPPEFAYTLARIAANELRDADMKPCLSDTVAFIQPGK